MSHPSSYSKCRVLLFRGKGLMSRLILWQTRSTYSHAALLLPDGTVLESWQGAGVRTTRLKSRLGVDAFTVHNMTDQQWKTAIQFAQGQIGKGYDYWAIIRFISRNRMPENDRYFCSELVVEALESAGVKLLERTHPWAISPGLLALSPRLDRADLPHLGL